MPGLTAVSSVHALPTLVNGGFESGFDGWSQADQFGSEGGFSLQTGTASPLDGDAVPAPPQGTSAAMTDGFGPGSHVLYQDTVASAGNATLSFDPFVGNRADRFALPPSGSLDFALTSPMGVQTLNQQVRVDILRAGADPFSAAGADIVLTLYQSQVGAALVGGYGTVTIDISPVLSAYSGETLRLRFAETDNIAPFRIGIDNVRIAAVPEPASALMLGAGMAALLALRGRTSPR